MGGDSEGTVKGQGGDSDVPAGVAPRERSHQRGQGTVWDPLGDPGDTLGPSGWPWGHFGTPRVTLGTLWDPASDPGDSLGPCRWPWGHFGHPPGAGDGVFPLSRHKCPQSVASVPLAVAGGWHWVAPRGHRGDSGVGDTVTVTGTVLRWRCCGRAVTAGVGAGTAAVTPESPGVAPRGGSAGRAQGCPRCPLVSLVSPSLGTAW